MPRSKLPSLNSIKDGSFEPNRKNAISLGDDSVLSTDSKPIKIGDKSSILELSEDSLIIRGAIEFDTLLRGILNSPNERMAFTAKTGEYRWYSISNDEDYVRMYVLGGNCLLQAVDASGGTQADISLDAGNDIILDAETGVFKFEKAGDLDDLCTLTVAANGATTIATADSDGAAGHLTLDIDGDITLDAQNKQFYIARAGTNYLHFNMNTADFKIMDTANQNDYFNIGVDTEGATTISTVDADTAAGHLTLDIDGDISLDSHSGNFIAKAAGTQFSADNSAYAGMILGYTRLEGDLTNQSTFEIQNSMTVEDSTHKITFKTPPSENVEIFASFCVDISSTDTEINVGLSDNATYNSVGQKFEYDNRGVFFSDDEANDIVSSAKWVLQASELADVGSSNTFYIGFSTSGATKTAYLRYGLRASVGVTDHPFIIKATALPETIYDGS